MNKTLIFIACLLGLACATSLRHKTHSLLHTSREGECQFSFSGPADPPVCWSEIEEVNGELVEQQNCYQMDPPLQALNLDGSFNTYSEDGEPLNVNFSGSCKGCKLQVWNKAGNHGASRSWTLSRQSGSLTPSWDNTIKSWTFSCPFYLYID